MNKILNLIIASAVMGFLWSMSGVPVQAQPIESSVLDSNAPTLVADSEKQLLRAKEKWAQLSPEQKEQYKEKMKRLKDMDPRQKKEIRQRFEEYKKLPPERKTVIKENWQKYRNLDESKRIEARDKFQQWKKLTSGQKDIIRERRKKFQGMPPEARQRILENKKRWNDMGEGPRQKIREKAKERGMEMPREPRQKLRDDNGPFPKGSNGPNNIMRKNQRVGTGGERVMPPNKGFNNKGSEMPKNGNDQVNNPANRPNRPGIPGGR